MKMISNVNVSWFFRPQNEKAEKIKETVKQLYNFGKSVQIENHLKKLALDELVIDQMDEEQIWQQMEINVSFVAIFWQISTNLLNKNFLNKISFTEWRIPVWLCGTHVKHALSQSNKARFTVRKSCWGDKWWYEWVRSISGRNRRGWSIGTTSVEEEEEKNEE